MKIDSIFPILPPQDRESGTILRMYTSAKRANTIGFSEKLGKDRKRQTDQHNGSSHTKTLLTIAPNRKTIPAKKITIPPYSKTIPAKQKTIPSTIPFNKVDKSKKSRQQKQPALIQMGNVPMTQKTAKKMRPI